MVATEADEAVQLCRSLRFRGAYLYYAAAETGEKRIGATAIIKYVNDDGYCQTAVNRMVVDVLAA